MSTLVVCAAPVALAESHSHLAESSVGGMAILTLSGLGLGLKLGLGFGLGFRV